MNLVVFDSSSLEKKLKTGDWEKVKSELQKSLKEMTSSELEAIKEATDIENLTADELIKYFQTFLIGAGAATVLSNMGFGLFMALRTMIKAVSLALGVTFSFGVYTTPTSWLAWLIDPTGMLFVLLLVYGIIGFKG